MAAAPSVTPALESEVGKPQCPTGNHAAIATALRGVGYEGYVSVEMMQGPAGTSWRERLESALAVVNAAYGGARGACAA